MERINKIAEAFDKGTNTTVSLESEKYLEISDEFSRMNPTPTCYGTFNKKDSKLSAIVVTIKGRTICFIKESDLVKCLQDESTWIEY